MATFAEGTPHQWTEEAEGMSSACRADAHHHCTGTYQKTRTRKAETRCLCTCHGTTPAPAPTR